MSIQQTSDQRQEVFAQASLQGRALMIALAVSLILALGCGCAAAGLKGGWIAAAWGVAFLLPPFIVGMLFGIPKKNDGADTGKTPSQLTMNGNFAQISDWMTKMITGATLVSAKNIPSYIYRAGQFAGSSMTGKWGAQEASIGSAIAVLFSGLGFIAGYLFTSVYLTVILDITEQSLGVEAVTDQMSATEKNALLKDVGPPGLAVAIPAPKSAAQDALLTAEKVQTASAVQKLQDVPIDLGASADALELLGNAKLNVGKFDEAAQAFGAAVRKNGARYRLYQSLATALFRLERIPDAVMALERVRPLLVGETANRILTFYEYLTYYCLYLPEPASYQKCILYAKEFLAEASDTYGGILINLACAYGLKASDLLKQDPKANIDEEAQAARQAVDRALTLSPNWRGKIELLMTPAAEDRDLAAFRNHPAFANLFAAPQTVA